MEDKNVMTEVTLFYKK